MTSESMKSPERYVDLDGIRGWAAVSVMFYHMIWESLGMKYPELKNSFLAILLNGSLDVSIFFVLSGEALSVSFWKKPDAGKIKAMAIKRYPRLTTPIFFSCLISFVILLFGWNFNRQAGQLLLSHDWLEKFLQVPAGEWTQFLKFSFWSVYFKYPSTLSYNPMLWTMGIELLGSYLVFIVLYIITKISRRILLPIGIMWLLSYIADANLSCCIAGVFIAYLRSVGHFEKMRTRKWSQIFSWAMIVVLLILCGQLQLMDIGERWHFALICPVILYCIHANTWLTEHFFRTKLSSFFGKISFPIYLMHFAVIISFMSWLVLKLEQNGLLSLVSALAVVVFSATICFGLAELFTYIEKLTKILENLFLQTFLGASKKLNRRETTSNFSE